MIDAVRTRFADLAPEELVRFSCPNGPGEPLVEGDTILVKIRMAEEVKVRVSDVSENSFTLATLRGHPEAGRITFGAYRNEHGDIIFHIRSRARSRSKLHVAGFLVMGDPMQNNTWTDFIDRLAHIVGDGIVGSIHSEKAAVEPIETDEFCEEPTFIARGD